MKHRQSCAINKGEPCDCIVRASLLAEGFTKKCEALAADLCCTTWYDDGERVHSAITDSHGVSYAHEEIERGVMQLSLDPLLMAVKWSEDNREAYMQLVEWAFEDIAHHSRPSIGLYAELLRRPHFANRLRLQHSDRKFLLNNNLRADLARLIMREYPQVQFPTREAKADRWSSCT